MIKDLFEYITRGVKSLINTKVYKKEIDIIIEDTILTTVLYLEGIVGHQEYWATIKLDELQEHIYTFEKLKHLPFNEINNIFYIKYKSKIQLEISKLIKEFKTHSKLINSFENDYETEIIEFLNKEFAKESLSIMLRMTSLVGAKKCKFRIQNLLEILSFKNISLSKEEFSKLKKINRNKTFDKVLNKNYKELGTFDNALLKIEFEETENSL